MAVLDKTNPNTESGYVSAGGASTQRRPRIRLTSEEMAGVRRILADPEPPTPKMRQAWQNRKRIRREDAW